MPCPPFLSDFWNLLNSPVDVALERIYRTPSKQWVAQFAPVAAAPKLATVQQNPILPSKHYISVTAQKTVLPYVRIKFESFYPTVHSTIIVHDDNGDARSLSTFSSLDSTLIAIDPRSGEKMVHGPRTLLEYAPFRGTQFASTIALLAVKAVDYAEPLISTLQKLSVVAGATFFSVAAPLAEPLLTGIQALAKAAGPDDGTQVVYAGNLPLNTGIFLIAAIETSAFNWADYSFASDYTLLRSGIPIDKFPYMVLTIEVSEERPNWKQIPDIRAAESVLNDAVKAAGRKIAIENSEERNKVEDALYAFTWQCANSQDLCPEDADRVADLTKKKIQGLMNQANLGLGPVATSRAVGRIPTDGFSLDDIDLFPRPGAAVDDL